MDAPKDLVVDHINGNALDNRRCNLRICTYQQNNYNAFKRTVGTCPFKGVYYRPYENHYIAQIWDNGKRRHLGYFTDQVEAAITYDKAARELRGEFARVNFPVGDDEYGEM
jgi:hypothetical protein